MIWARKWIGTCCNKWCAIYPLSLKWNEYHLDDYGLKDKISKL